MQFFLNTCTILLGLILASLLFFSVIYQWEKGRKSIKGILIGIFLLCALGCGIHAMKQSEFDSHVQEYSQAFKEGETLICTYNYEDLQVHKTDFIYFRNLFIFSGKNSLKGVNVPIVDCTKHIQVQDIEILHD